MSTPDVPGGARTGQPREDNPWAPVRDRARDGIAAVGHGAVFFALMLAGLLPLLLILALLLPGPGLLAYGLGSNHANAGAARVLALPALVVSLFLVSRVLLVVRRPASLTRRLAGRWCGVSLADPYLPRPEGGLGRRLGWLLTDRATWRDLLWVTVNACGGWILALAPAGLLAFGVLGVVAPYASLELRVAAIGAALPGYGRPRGCCAATAS
jgi:Putative sensor